jgi:hypothetical protein
VQQPQPSLACSAQSAHRQSQRMMPRWSCCRRY